jgi:hypothetical protein
VTKQDIPAIFPCCSAICTDSEGGRWKASVLGYRCVGSDDAVLLVKLGLGMSRVIHRAALCALVGVGLCAALFRDDGGSLSAPLISLNEV